MFFTTYLRLIFGLDVPFLRSLFVFSLSARAARTVFCSSFVRLFSICPCGSHYLSVRLALSARAARTICPCGSHYLPVWLALSVRAARTVLRLPVRLAPACVAHTFNSSFFTKLLPHTYQNTSQRFFSRQS